MLQLKNVVSQKARMQHQMLQRVGIRSQTATRRIRLYLIWLRGQLASQSASKSSHSKGDSLFNKNVVKFWTSRSANLSSGANIDSNNLLRT